MSLSVRTGVVGAEPAAASPATQRADADRDHRRTAADLVRRSIEDEKAIESARAVLGETRSAERFEHAVAETDMARRRKALLALSDNLAFEPTAEAPTPEGWPAFTPIQEIELKSYPAYRTAVTRATASLPDSVMFWKLFLHIQRNQISMTAPVEMTLDDAKKQNTTAMAFMYESDEIGKLGEDVNVTVVDVPAQLAISIGLRGEMDPKEIAAASDRIDQWLADHANNYAPAGDLRVLGYNSPSLDSDKKYYEVQRVITQKAPAK